VKLLEGLDFTILKLSAVLADNEKFRIDDGYFAKLPVETQRRIEAMSYSRLGELCSVFRKGIFDIKAETYAESGVPFVRIGNLRHGLIDDAGLAYITRERHRAEKATALRYGDLVLSKTAYAAASFVNLAECNVSQDTIAVRLSSDGAEAFKSGFIAAFLNSRYGLALMGRQFQGNAQAHLSLPDGRKVPIPRFDVAFQTTVDRALREADALFRKAAAEMESANEMFSLTLGLNDWQPPKPLTYTMRASQALAARRLDAEYFAPRARELLDRLGASGPSVRDVAPPRHEHFVPARDGEFDYIEIGNLHSDGTASSTRIAHCDAPSRATQFVRAGDVITSTVRPIRRLSALIFPEQAGSVCSSGFVVLAPRAVAPEVLLTYLRLPLVCELMSLHTSASMYPAISETDLLQLPFPEIGAGASKKIVNAVRNVHTSRQRARELLAAAQRAVEIAIEESEAQAVAFLTEHT
jgi:type I restriction enzyme, S subunit